MRTTRGIVLAMLWALLAACAPGSEEVPRRVEEGATQGETPSILLVTLDTTRADSVGYESPAVETPALEALARRGQVFSQAYGTAPMTLPSHASMLTGLYPAEHGIHENGRTLSEDSEVLAGLLREAGYATAAFVSGFPLSRQFGLARGFGHFDDHLGEGTERSAAETTQKALAYLRQAGDGPVFLWVHLFDPHEPYAAPEPFRSRYPKDPYLAEIAAMDREVGRLVEAFEARFSEQGTKLLVVGDHGEGLGDHGETYHGNLLYQGVMRVPLIVAGTGISAGRRDHAVSVRRVFDTVLHWAGLGGEKHFLSGVREVILAEAMKPLLQYGWQPQVMAVGEGIKVIRSGGLEVYDLRSDPGETKNLAGSLDLDREVRRALREYPLPGGDDGAEEAEPLSREDQERLASLGYAAPAGRAPQRADAPSPRQMTHLFGSLDRGSGLFVRQRYEEAIPVYEEVLAADPENLMVTVRLAVASSVLGRDERALELFERARSIDAGSLDLRHYLAMHHFRAGEWEDAAPLFESVLAGMPRRLPALESLARIREKQGRIEEAMSLLARAAALQKAPSKTLVRLGDLRMSRGDTAGAIDAYEEAWQHRRGSFERFLELGVLHLAAGRPAEARDFLDQVPPSHPGYPMALFKRAQVSVLLNEPDRAERIRRARDNADATTGPLILRETLFQGVGK